MCNRKEPRVRHRKWSEIGDHPSVCGHVGWWCAVGALLVMWYGAVWVKWEAAWELGL